MATMNPSTHRRPVDCILVKDGTPESEEAERLLREAGTHFGTVPPGVWKKKRLELQTEDFGTLLGLKGVKTYIAVEKSQLLSRARGTGPGNESM